MAKRSKQILTIKRIANLVYLHIYQKKGTGIKY